MKVFDLPSPCDPRGSIIGYQSVQVYPWTENRFVIVANLSEHRYVPHWGELDFYNTQIYSIGEELNSILYNKIPNVLPEHFWFTELFSDEKNTEFFIHPNSSDMICISDFNKKINKNIHQHPKGCGRSLRVDNTAILCLGAYQKRPILLDIFLKDIEIQKNEVVMLDFHTNQSYSYKIMTLGDKNSIVINLAFSLDKLTACAIIKSYDDTLKAVVWDLDA